MVSACTPSSVAVGQPARTRSEPFSRWSFGLARPTLTRMRWLGVWVLAPALACACGGAEEPPDGGAGTSSAGTNPTGTGGAAGTSASGGTAGAGSGSGGGSGASGTSGGGSGGVPSGSCSGTFGAPTVVLELPGQRFGSLSLGPGELELLYATSDYSMLPELPSYRRSVRTSTSVPFPEGQPVPELDAPCDPTFERSGDLSLDGLRYYYVCYSLEEPMTVPLRIARRASLDAPFVVDERTYGDVGTGPSLGPGELELFTSPAEFQSTPTLRHERPDQDAAFGASSELMGLTLVTPELSADGRFLFGALYGLDTDVQRLMMAERASNGVQFGSPVPVITAATDEIVGSAAISADCRSLYYISVLPDGDLGNLLYRMVVVKR
jgi:hypothetical protein